MDKYVKFKHLLEYFVSHLEWVVSENTNHPGYNTYIAPLIEQGNFNESGFGYKGYDIQKQIIDWSDYDGDTICITISSTYPDRKGSYLHWINTEDNVVASWNNGHVESLCLTQQKSQQKSEKQVIAKSSISNLGLFDGKSPNSSLKSFFDKFLCMHMGINQLVSDFVSILRSNYNLIFTGAPGTGKTYLAKQIAKLMIMVKTDDDLDKSEQFAFVQFHPSYDYTDFVEGLRPTPPDALGNIGFELKNGVFKEFCEKARKNPEDGKSYVFVIDEINRGEISKIFGELFFSIDPGYRGEKGAVYTQYANMHEMDEKFYVPENVYIIGTMNDIDRSVESFDFAMRRRFIWQEITAEESAESMDLPQEYKTKMKNLNDKISEIEGLGSSYHIGGAYFLDKDGVPIKDFEEIWTLRLKPLLREYLRGMPNADDNLNELRNAYETAADN